MDFKAILLEATGAAVAATINGVDRGACGFAWVTVDGNEPIARFCRKEAAKPEHQNHSHRALYGSKGYPKGWQWWKPGQFGGQAVDVHEAGARAFRDVLGKYGIRADVGSRLD